MHSAHYTDGFIKTLWDWCQSNEKYRNKTTLVITTDHGRGCDKKEDWRHHGAKMARADEIWLAVIGPDTPATGEVKTAGQLYQNQVAQTVAAFLRVPYQSNSQAGEKVKTSFK